MYSTHVTGRTMRSIKKTHLTTNEHTFSHKNLRNRLMTRRNIVSTRSADNGNHHCRNCGASQLYQNSLITFARQNRRDAACRTPHEKRDPPVVVLNYARQSFLINARENNTKGCFRGVWRWRTATPPRPANEHDSEWLAVRLCANRACQKPKTRRPARPRRPPRNVRSSVTRFILVSATAIVVNNRVLKLINRSRGAMCNASTPCERSTCLIKARREK